MWRSMWFCDRLAYFLFSRGNTEILRVRSNYESEIQRLNSLVERMRIKYAHILQDMERKTKELDALTTVFDEWCSTVRK